MSEVALNLVIHPSGMCWLGRQPLGLSTSTKSCGEDSTTSPAENKPQKKRAARGSKGISSHGRSQVRDGAYILEEDHGRNNVAFLTLTLPFVQDEALGKAYKLWGRAVGAFEDRMRRKLPPHLQRWVHCTEDQKRGAPHLHMAYPGRTHRQAAWLIDKSWFQQAWHDIWQKLMPEESKGLSWQSSTRIEAVRKSVSGYLGKYISKGGRPVNPERHPSSWWGTTDGIKKDIKERTFKACIKMPCLNWDNILEKLVNATNIQYSKFFELPSGMTWGIAFRVDPVWAWKVASDFLLAYEEIINVY